MKGLVFFKKRQTSWIKVRTKFLLLKVNPLKGKWQCNVAVNIDALFAEGKTPSARAQDRCLNFWVFVFQAPALRWRLTAH